MNRKSLLGILVTAVVVGGLLFLFSPQWVALFIGLIVLITGQVILLRRHTTVLPARNKRLRKAARAQRMAPPAKSSPPASAPAGGAYPAQTAGAPSPPNAAPAEEPVGTGASSPPDPQAVEEAVPEHIDKELFSRFRAHLETMEEAADAYSRGESPAKSDEASRSSPAPDPPTADSTEDLVDLSAAALAAVRPVQTLPASKEVPSLPAPAAPPTADPAAGDSGPDPENGEEQDLFADLRPSPDQVAAPPPPTTPPPGGPPASEAAEGEAGDAPRRESAPSRGSPPPVDEVQAALELASSPENLREEGGSLLRMAEEAHAKGDLSGLEAGLDQYFSLLEDNPGLIDWRAEWLRARLAVRQGRADQAAEAFGGALQRGGMPPEEGVSGLVEETVAGAEDGQADALRLALLHKALSVFRQEGQREAMDRLYERLEEIQERMGDERALVQMYKNHLTIREVLGHREGQLDLIDKIGNRYYRLGDTAPAKEYYEMGLKLRAELDDQAEDAASPETAPDDEAPPGKSPPGGG